jgi:hypothetical protein
MEGTKRARTTEPDGAGDDKKRKEFEEHARKMVGAHFITHAGDCEVQAGNMTVWMRIEDGDFVGEDDDLDEEVLPDALNSAMHEHFGDVLPDALNDILSPLDAEAPEWEMFFGSTAIHIKLKVEVADGIMKVVDAQVPTVTAEQYNVICAMIDYE